MTKHVAEQFLLPFMADTVVDHSVRKHAKFSPSKMNYLDARVGGCVGFQGKEGTNAAAEEGTEHHEVLDVLMQAWWNLGKGRGSFEGFLFTERIRRKWTDEVDYLYVFCARSIDKYLAKADELFLEQTVEIRVDTRVVTWGHFDVLIRIGTAGILIDWKFGQIPVLPADENRQGFAYAVGALQKWYNLQRVGIVFVQPRLQWVSRFMVERKDAFKYQQIVQEVVEAAERFSGTDDPHDAELLNPGSACTYCARAANCSAFLNKLQVAAPRFGALPAPQDFRLDAIDTPEKAAVAYAWAAFLDDKLDEVKARCRALAEQNGGEISCPSPDGHPLRYRLAERAIDRSVGSAPQVAESLAQWVAPEQILAAATLSLGKLEDVVVPAMQEQDDTLTKKRAKELLASHLESNGLLTRPDGKVQFLKQVKEPKQKQLA